MPAINTNRLDERMKAAGLTPRQLADRAGCTAPAVNNVLAGRRTPSLRLTNRLAQALGCTFADLHDPAATATASPLRARRVAAGIPAGDFAARIGISCKHLKNVELGWRNLTTRVAEAAAAELGCQPSDLTDEDVAA